MSVFGMVWRPAAVAALLLAAAPAVYGAGSTEPAPPMKVEPMGDYMSAGCGGGVVAQGWTVTLQRDRLMWRTTYGPGKTHTGVGGLPKAVTAAAAKVEALFDRASHLDASDMPQAGAAEVGCTLEVRVADETLKGSFPYALGTKPPPAEPTPAEKVFLDLVALAKSKLGAAK